MSVIEFEIPKWTKFNPRSDKANYSWFRFENAFFQDQAVFSLTDSQRVIYVFCLCEVSKKNGGAVSLLPNYVAAILGHKESQVLKDFQQLYKAGLLTSKGRPQDVQETSFVPATNERTDETLRDVTDVTDVTGHVFDFEAAWEAYPRKKEKSVASARFVRLIKSETDYLAFLEAVKNYAKYIHAKATEEKFIKHMASFLGTEKVQGWRDWVSPEQENLCYVATNRAIERQRGNQASLDVYLASLDASKEVANG